MRASIHCAQTRTIGGAARGSWLAVLLLLGITGPGPIQGRAAGGPPAPDAGCSPHGCGVRTDDFGLTVEYAVTNTPVSGGQVDFTATVAVVGAFQRITVTFTTAGNVVLSPPLDPVVLTNLQPGDTVDITGTLDITTNGSGTLLADVDAVRASSCGEKPAASTEFAFYVLDDGVTVYTGAGDSINLEAARIEDLYSNGIITEEQAQEMANELLMTENVETGGGQLRIVPGAGGRTNVTISGYVQYYDIAGGLHRGRLLEMEVFNPYFSALFPVGSGTADANGNFSLTFEPFFGLLEPHTLLLRIYARNQAANVRNPILALLQGSTYFLQKNYYNVPDGATLSGEVITVGNCRVEDVPFSIADALLEGYEYYRTMNGGNPPNPLSVNWPEEWLGSSFDILFHDSIQIGPNLGYSWDIILHEYGHYLAFIQNLNCFDCIWYHVANGCPHAGWDDQVLAHNSKEQGVKLAWQEGLATYLDMAAQDIAGTAGRNIPLAGDVHYQHNESRFPSPCTAGENVANCVSTDFDYESAGRVQFPCIADSRDIPTGEGVETNVTRVLWDVADGANSAEPEDTIALGHQSLWNELTGGGLQGGCRRPPANTRYFNLSDFWFRLTVGKPNAEKLQYGAILELNGVGPKHIKPAKDAKMTRKPMRFSWSGTQKLNRFKVKFYDAQFTQILESTPQNAAADPGDARLFVNSNGWTPSDAEWRTVRNFATNGVGTNGVYWAIEGENTVAPATGPYLSGAWRLGTAQAGEVDIAFVIDISGSMTEEIAGIKTALLQAVDNTSQGICSDPNYASNPGCWIQHKCPTCPPTGVFLPPTTFQLTTFKDSGVVTVDGVDNIFGAGHAVAPDPGGGGGGTLPPLFPLPPGTGRVLSFSSITGWVSCGCPSPNPPYPPSNSCGPDGGSCASGTTDILSWDGISGVINSQKTMFLCGVFLGPNEPHDPAPARLNFSNNMNFLTLSPLIGQTFYIGDGLTGTGSGSIQQFFVPDTATRFYMGFADALEFGFPTSLPGYYWDNCGHLDVKFPVVSSNPPTCCKDAIRAQVNALTAADESGCGEPSVQALLQGTEPLKKGGTVFIATDEPPATGTNLYAAIAALRLRGAKVNVLLTGNFCTSIRDGRQTDALEAFSELAEETGGSFQFYAEVGQEFVNAAVNITQAGLNPAIVAAAPLKARRSTVTQLTLTGQGTNFSPASSVTFNSVGLQVADVEVTGPTELAVLVVVAPDAALGYVDVAVSTPLGPGVVEEAMGVGVVEVLTAAATPRLVSITPPVVGAGQTTDVEVRGANTHFTAAAVLDLGEGVAVNTVEVLCPTALWANLTTEVGASTAFRGGNVTTGVEVAENEFDPFFRLQAVPAAAQNTLSVEPMTAYAGETLLLHITLEGLSLPPDQSVPVEVTFHPADMAITGVEVCSPTTLDVTVFIVSDAAPGFHDVSVAIPDGSAAGLAVFNVLAADADCNANGRPDGADIAGGTSADCNSNAIPDDCEADCNSNGVPDRCDVDLATSPDCNCNRLPDECELSGPWDCDHNGTPDDCDLASGAARDCNGNGLPDSCDLFSGFSSDCNTNAVPDSCDIAVGTASDCNSNAVPDSCDLAQGSATDCQPDGTLDECELTGVPMVPWDMTERNATAWTWWAEDGTVTLSDDLAFQQVGTASLRMDATGGFDNYVRYPAGAQAGWDVSTVQAIEVWFYAVNPNLGFQGGSPWIRLGDAAGYYEWHPTWDILNQGIGQWVHFIIPIPGDGTWLRTTSGTPSLAHVDYLEIHADTWGAGFTLWIDGVHFQPTPGLIALDCNTNGVPDECDLAQGTSRDCNQNTTPDDCESGADCNTNAIFDVCDLAAGTSADCNTDGTPDECQKSHTAGALYAVEREGSTFYEVHPQDGSVTVLGLLHDEVYDIYGAYGLAQHPLTQELYVLAELDSTSNGYGQALATMDPLTGALDVIGFVQDAALADIAFREDGTLYGMDEWGVAGELLRVDITDARLTSIGLILDGGDGQAIAFQPGTGLLYYWYTPYWTYRQPTTRLLRVDLDTLQVTEVATYDTGYFPQALVFHPQGVPLLGFGNVPGDNLFQINPSNGALTASGATGPIVAGTAFRVGDCNQNGTLDDCEPDCNGNNTPDDCDVAAGEIDCDENGVPDLCEIPGGTFHDCNTDGAPDHCEIIYGSAMDCNANLVPDECDLTGGSSRDCNANGSPDECEIGADAPPADMTELNAASWASWAQDGQVTLFNDIGFTQVGAGSLRMEATGGADNYVRYPAVQEVHWDVTTVSLIRAWFYAENPNSPWFQEQSPWIRLGNPEGYYQWRPTWDILNQAVGQWVEFSVPMSGDALWQRSVSGTPSPANIGYIEIHADTWGAGFTLWIDGLRLDPNPTQFTHDCNTNGILDVCDLQAGTSADCDSNGRPDECDADCNTNGLADGCDIVAGTSADCDGNGTPDECEAPEPDCNSNGIRDLCDVYGSTSVDCNINGTPDECETDCNANGVFDTCDVTAGTSADCNSNSIPDECEADCNSNGTADSCDVTGGASQDCNLNGVPDECDLAGGAPDCNHNGVPDACDGGGVFWQVGFENGLPQDWTTNGLWHVTDQCVRPSACDLAWWAYYGVDSRCNFDLGDLQTWGVLTAPPNVLPRALAVTLTYCSVYDGEAGNSGVEGWDWAWVNANGVEVDDASQAGSGTTWQTRRVDLTTYAGQTVVLQWRFDSLDGFANGGLGWQVDDIQITANGLDCNTNGILDGCDISAGTSPDVNGNAVPDECEGLGDMDDDGDVDLSDYALWIACLNGPNVPTPPPGCAPSEFIRADLSGDNDVDLADYAAFQGLLGM